MGSLGINYLKEIRAPLNHIPMVATGGVNLQNINSVLDAGAIAVGLGGNLVDKQLVKEGKFDELEQACACVRERSERGEVGMTDIGEPTSLRRREHGAHAADERRLASLRAAIHPFDRRGGIQRGYRIVPTRIRGSLDQQAGRGSVRRRRSYRRWPEKVSTFSLAERDAAYPTAIYFKEFKGYGDPNVYYYRRGSAMSQSDSAGYRPSWLAREASSRYGHYARARRRERRTRFARVWNKPASGG